MWARYGRIIGGSAYRPLGSSSSSGAHLQTLTRACGGRKWRLLRLNELMRITKKKKNKSLSNDGKMAGRRDRTNKLNHIVNGHSTYSFIPPNSLRWRRRAEAHRRAPLDIVFEILFFSLPCSIQSKCTRPRAIEKK